MLPQGGAREWRGRLGTAMALLLGSKLLNVQVGGFCSLLVVAAAAS